MSTYAEMSYDELEAYAHTVVCGGTEWDDIGIELYRKSGAMDAICKLAADMDAEGLVCVPRDMDHSMWREFGYALEDWKDGKILASRIWAKTIEAAPPLTREA